MISTKPEPGVVNRILALQQFLTDSQYLVSGVPGYPLCQDRCRGHSPYLGAGSSQEQTSLIGVPGRFWCASGKAGPR